MNTQQTQDLKTRDEQEAFVRDALDRAEKFRKKKNYKEGISLLVEALKYGIDRAAIYYRLGNLYIDGGDLARAEYAYNRAITVDPKHANAMHNLAIVYKKQKKIPLYIKTYKKSQKMAIRHPRRVDLSSEQKTGIRWFSLKLLVGGLIIGGAITALLFFLLFR